MSFGSNLKKIRLDNGLTQDELAKKLNTSRSNIANYENDKNMPSVEILEKLSKTLNCSTDYLMGIKDYKNQDDYINNNTEQALQAVTNNEYLIKKYPEFDPDSIASKMFACYKNDEDSSPILDEAISYFSTDEQIKARQVILFIYTSLLFSIEASKNNIEQEFKFAYHKEMEGLTEEEIADALRFYKKIKYGDKDNK